MTGTTYWIRTTLIERPPPSLKLHDAGEDRGIEARAADERAIDVGLRHEGIDIIRLDAAAVEEADALRRRRRGAAADLAADGIVDLLRLSGRGGAAGADRPHRLVGDDAGGELLGADVGEGRVDLPGNDGAGRLRLTLLERLADADDRNESGGQHGVDTPIDGLVRLAEELPALGVADDDERAPRLAQHRDRDLARVGCLRLLAPSPSARSPPPRARGVRAAPAPRGTRATRRRRSTRGSPPRASRPVGARRPSHRPRRPSCPRTPPSRRPRRACRG